MATADSIKKNKKKCTICAEYFSIKAFSERSTCKTCYADKRSRRKIKVREIISSIKKEMKCEKCGFDDPRALHFHHKSPKDKKNEVSALASSGYSLEAIKKEINKCIVLCANCHSIKHQKKQN